MKIREKTKNEIDKLNSDELLKVKNFISSIKKDKKVQRDKGTNSNKDLSKIRKYLNNLNTSLSEDIINSRNDRI